MASVPVYCLCGKPYDPTKFMIQCDACKEWFHGSCVGLYEHQSADIEKYHCPKCEKMFGPSISKRRTNWHRHDYCEVDAESKAVQTGTPVFIKELKSRHFPSADEVLLLMRGHQLALPYFIQNGFDRPILSDTTEGLGLVVPPSSFSVEDVEKYLGSDWEIDAIDVTRQEDIHMTLSEFFRYYNNPTRTRVINVISLEFSNSKLSPFVEPPYIVNKLSWIHNIWPEQLPEDCKYTKPEVQKYCLIGVRDSYTDFHIDFGGTSVWYHVLKGEKVFYLIRPTQANLALYKRWMASSNRSETFFGDQVDACYRCTVKQGQTLLIPTAWIHAVFTPVDSLVFGGNFLHSLNLPLQLQVYDIEKRIKTPEKFRFPHFETCNWYAAKHILDELKEQTTTDRKPLPYLVQGAKSLVSALKNWTQDKDHLKAHKDDIPLSINYSKLIKDLAKEVRHAEKTPQNKKQNLRQLPPRDRRGRGLAKLGIQASGREGTETKPPGRSKKGSSKTKNHNIANTIGDVVTEETPKPLKLFISRLGASGDGVTNATGDPQFCSSSGLSQPDPSIQPTTTPVPVFKFPPSVVATSPPVGTKVDESVYDFHDSDDEALIVDENPPPRLATRKNGSRKINDYSKKQAPLKLKLSFNGKPPPLPDAETGAASATWSAQPEADSEAAPASPKLAGIEELLRASCYATEDSARQAKTYPREEESFEEEPTPSEEPKVKREEPIEASEGDDSFVVSQSGRTSPSTREAIQGMLSMGRAVQFSSGLAYPSVVIDGQPMPSGSPNAAGGGGATGIGGLKRGSSKFASPRSKNGPSEKRRRKSKACVAEMTEEEEFLGNCHQDEEFVYPSLEASDEDGPIFKSRGRNKNDEAWNPKARLVPNFPKPERPVREGVKKEAVESGLAAAAARLAHLPAPKRPYQRRKPLKAKARPSQPQEVVDPKPCSSTDPNVFDPLAPLTPKNAGPFKGKKAKKGFATAKQRLGRILKIHKMLH